MKTVIFLCLIVNRETNETLREYEMRVTSFYYESENDLIYRVRHLAATKYRGEGRNVKDWYADSLETTK